jgi:hypothetical protein
MVKLDFAQFVSVFTSVVVIWGCFLGGVGMEKVDV